MDALVSGSSFPAGPVECTVHSVYTNAINLQIPESPIVFTLVSKPELMHPLAALVSGPGGLVAQFTSLGIEPKATCSFDGRKLNISKQLEISFTDTKRMPQVDELPPPLELAAPVLQDRLAQAGALLEHLQARQNTELRWLSQEGRSMFLPEEGTGRAGRFDRAVSRIVKSLAAESPYAALAASLDLVGLGQGLTPSGDDFLCGLAMALYMLVKNPLVSPAFDAITIESWLWGLAAKLGLVPTAMGVSKDLTGIVSKSFLYLASQGRFSLLLVQFARAFADPVQNLTGILETMSQYGHSSGLDSATGFLFGMAAVDKRRN